MGLNLHAIVAGAIGAVNDFTTASIRKSDGTYVTAGDGTRTPGYGQTDGVSVQVQPITGKDLRMMEALNIEGVDNAVYLNGSLLGATRVGKHGGDLMRFDGKVWLVTVVLETWRTGWCKVGVTLQKDPPWPDNAD